MIALEQHDQEEQQESRPWHFRRQPAGLLASPLDIPLMGNETVLVVDDEPLVRGALSHVLREFGYRVLEASCAVEAQRLTRMNPRIDLLLTDFCMPLINGLELARWFKRTFPAMKVLITTGSSWELASELERHEEIAVLPKPFDGLQLGQMLRLMLE